MPLRVTGRIERYLTAPKQLIYNQKFRVETSKVEFLQQTVKVMLYFSGYPTTRDLATECVAVCNEVLGDCQYQQDAQG